MGALTNESPGHHYVSPDEDPYEYVQEHSDDTDSAGSDWNDQLDLLADGTDDDDTTTNSEDFQQTTTTNHDHQRAQVKWQECYQNKKSVWQGNKQRKVISSDLLRFAERQFNLLW